MNAYDSVDEYYAPTTKIVYVPVVVRYHEPTGVVYNFTKPTLEQVEDALKKDNEEANQLIESFSKIANDLNAAMDLIQKIKARRNI